MIEFFHSVVRLRATLSVLALLSFGHDGAHFRLVCSQGSPVVFFLIVEIGASLQVVTCRIYLARIQLEKSKIQESTILLAVVYSLLIRLLLVAFLLGLVCDLSAANASILKMLCL